MSESLTFSGDILPAIKCDRRAQCANCADAGVECQRRRRGRPPKKRSLQSALGPQENIVTFERQPPQTQRGNRQSGRRAVTRNLNRSSTLEHSQLDNQISDSRERSPTTTAQSTPSVEGPNYHAIQAKNIIQLELNDSRHINRGRQSILRSALQLVNRIAESEPQHPDEIIEEPQPSDPALTIPDAPPRELLFMLLKGPPESICIQWPDHISRKTYEKMATALLEHEPRLQGQLFHQYCICIYVKAIFHLYQASRTVDNPLLKSQLSQSRSIYITATIRSIEKLSILKRPDLSTIQALLSSALLMQHLGRLNQCWVLTSYAARQIASLNYHKIRRIPAHSDLELEVYSVVYWCYYLDRTLSSLLGRPPSLPDLEVSPTDLIVLDPCSPYDTLLHVLLDLAQVQGKLHGISSCAKNVSNSQALETCQLLESRMQSILREMPSSRDSLPKMVQYDWVAVDFCYYAIFVEIDRTRLKSSFSPAIHRECLVHARKSLEAFHFLQQHPEEMPGFEEPYPSFLTWTLFFYPLSAFFVVICNIIGTLDHSDFELLQQITQSLSQFKQDPHLEKLLNLLQSLEDLCEPLFQGGNSGPENMSSNLGTSAPNQLIEPVTMDGILPSASFNNNFGLNDEPIPNPDLDASADWLMWQLFNSQIPAGWLSNGVDPFEI
ncbi:transcriptional regulator family: Fungal Specific TF [Aspergillus niger]|nr:transcriptional regulator family: Fungal Specific TF [Aspergillus niger]